MFNLNPFNRGPYNRSLTVETYFNVLIESKSDVSAIMNIEMPVAIVFESSTELVTQLIREYALDPEVIESATELVTQLIRERILSAAPMESATAFDVAVTYSHVEELTFTGGFKPGDKLVIDTKKMTVTLNGQNAMHMIDGDFFNLILGTNKLTYTDDASARDILTRITHRDKFLY